MKEADISYIQSTIRDNRKRGSVGQFLKENIKKESELSIVSAYFTIYAYDKLKEQLNSIKELKFLFGEPTFIKSLDPSKTNSRSFKIEQEDEETKIVIPTENKLSQKAIAKECADWIEKKVQIKSMVKPNFLHGKMYHIAQENGVEKASFGSSNFTVNGLGLGGSPNMELNMIVDSERDRIDLKQWFDEIWKDESGIVEDVKKDVVTYLKQLYQENGPEFIYFKTLYHIFEKFIEEQKKGGLLTKQTGFFESNIYKMLYKFQEDGVTGAINKILKHNGCIIADSVGLGKTFEALAVIKYFELFNERVLVLCPKKLKENWSIYKQNDDRNILIDDRFGYDILCHTDLGRKSGYSGDFNLETVKWGNYGLVVIDESHNFRGNPMDKVKDTGEVTMNRAKWLMEKIIKSGVKTKVLLLSATPVNNNLRDLRNQIYIITEGKNDALSETGIKDIALSLKNAQTNFTNWADIKKNPQRTVKQLIEKLDSSFFKLLDEITIARSRKHIINFYNAEAEVGKFPERLKPVSIYPSIDTKDRFFTYDALNKKILEYKLAVFNPSKYVEEDLKNKYGIKTKEEKEKERKEKEERKRKKDKGETAKTGGGELNFDQSDRENFLIGMMKINFLKRLESSIESFELSMDRTIKKIEKLEDKIKEYQKPKQKKEKVEIESPTAEDIVPPEETDDPEEWQVGKKLKFNLADIKLDDWLEDLKNDKAALSDLYNNAAAVTPDRDAKLKKLKKLIEDKVKRFEIETEEGIRPLNKGNKKIIVFTAFADTANYLFDEIRSWVEKDLKLNIALVAGSQSKTSFGRAEYFNVLTNFSPIAKGRNKMKTMPQEGEIDILIATDCISEGQNLQDCDYLINYDIHWNPVRIIQRFGRIDRLGSKNEKIQLVNFWPTKDLDNYINLKARVEARMALVDITATADDNLLTTEQIEELIEDDLKYRNRQLIKLQKEVLDLEDMNESISLTDFTLDDFRIELLHFLDSESMKEKIQKAPFGLYAVVASPSGSYKEELDLNKFQQAEKDIIQPGVVYCLKQKGDTGGNEEVNPLQPYFVVYIYENGQVRFNYTNAKQILEVYRLMCSGKKSWNDRLCDIFNKETKEGEDMEKYAELLGQAVDEIIRVFKKRSARKITENDRGALIIPKTKQPYEMNNFELVTWLVIK